LATFYDLQPGNRARPILTSLEPTRDNS